MPIPPEFNYSNEDEFIQKFLMPLLQRLGFSLVVNYHGRAEFGKDLIFAEIDHFGHVRYHGLQAKYEPSISLNEIENVISDGKQAFSNPFTHPQTGTIERISSFYAVNGGSISPEASQHYFNSLLPSYGGNARLLQAKDLLVLDRWASLNQTSNIVAIINGLRIELSFNLNVTQKRISVLQQSIDGKDAPWPLAEFKLNAVSAYLQQPILQSFFDTSKVLEYWELCNVCNKTFDVLLPGLFMPQNTIDIMNECLKNLQNINALSTYVRSALDKAQQTLGPLTAI